jgi:hypothetical protein
MFQGGSLRVIYIAIFIISCFVEAQESTPLTSCLSYEVSRIDKDTGKFVLENVFAPSLFENLNKNFPDKDIEWSAWTTSVDEYRGTDGKDKTRLKGCFDVGKIHDDVELISSIMKISMTRFQAAMKFYSKPDSEHVPITKIDSMLEGYKKILKNPKVKQEIRDKLEHNK